MECSLKRGSPARPKAQRRPTARNPVTRPVWPPGGPQNLRNSAFFAFRKGFCECPDRDVGHDSANTPKMRTKQCVLQHFQYIFTPRMPIIYSVLRGFVAYFRISSEHAQDSPGRSQDLRQTPPGRPQDAPGTPQDAPGTSETSAFPSSEKVDGKSLSASEV